MISAEDSEERGFPRESTRSCISVPCSGESDLDNVWVAHAFWKSPAIFWAFDYDTTVKRSFRDDRGGSGRAGPRFISTGEGNDMLAGGRTEGHSERERKKEKEERKGIRQRRVSRKKIWDSERQHQSHSSVLPKSPYHLQPKPRSRAHTRPRLGVSFPFWLLYNTYFHFINVIAGAETISISISRLSKTCHISCSYTPQDTTTRPAFK